MVYIAYDIFSTQIRKSGASTAASSTSIPAAAHSEHITPHGGRLPFPFGTTSEPPGPRLRARLSASQCGQAIPDRVCTLFTCAGRSSALRCVPPVSAAAPCERLVPLRCCPPPASLCKNRLGGVLFSCIWFARLSPCLVVLYVFLCGTSVLIAVLSLLRRRTPPYPILYHLAN